MAELRCNAFVGSSPLRTPVQCSRRAVFGERCWQHAEPTAPPVGTEAAEVWRELQKWDRDHPGAHACDRLLGDDLLSVDVEPMHSTICVERGLIEWLPPKRGHMGRWVYTELGERVAAYGRAQAEVTRG